MQFHIATMGFIIDLNLDCLLHIINFLSLDDQTKLARCCKLFNSLCLNEREFQRYVKQEFGSFDYRRIHRTCKTWRETAHHFHDTVLQVRLFIREVLPQWIFRLSDGHPWCLIFPESHMTRCTVLETIYLIECIHNVYPQLMEMTPSNDRDNDMFWQIIYKQWLIGPKSNLWDLPLTHAYFPPPRGQPDAQGMNNLVFFVRIHIQRSLSHFAMDMIDQTLDILHLPRSTPSTRNMLYKIICPTL